MKNNSKFNKFTYEHWGPGKPDNLKNKIIEALKKDFPALISTPAILPASGWHIRVCHTITKDGELIMYNPGNGCDEKEKISDIIKVTRKRGGGDILIIGLKNKNM